MSGLSLVMPMAGRGSRFALHGIAEPKPLIPLAGRPFFWWAVESVVRAAPVDRMVFVILEEHARDWKLDACIREYYPEAEIVAIPEVTAGSAQTAALGVARLESGAPVLINDCDHAFVASGLEPAAARLGSDQSAGLLLCFRAASPNYSYVKLGADGKVTGTVEKQVASPFAIAGCYGFSSPALFAEHYARYVAECPYPELFLSGMYNGLVDSGLPVEKLVLDEHFAFGTPQEFDAVQARLAARLHVWR